MKSEFEVDAVLDVVLGDNALDGFCHRFPGFIDSTFPNYKISFIKLCTELEIQHGARLLFKDSKPYCLRFNTQEDKSFFTFRYSCFQHENTTYY